MACERLHTLCFWLGEKNPPINLLLSTQHLLSIYKVKVCVWGGYSPFECVPYTYLKMCIFWIEWTLTDGLPLPSWSPGDKCPGKDRSDGNARVISRTARTLYKWSSHIKLEISGLLFRNKTNSHCVQALKFLICVQTVSLNWGNQTKPPKHGEASQFSCSV